jgi:hypothetical protein
LAATFADVDQLCFLARHRQQFGLYQRVIQHHISLCEQSRTTQRDQVCRTGTRTDQIHFTHSPHLFYRTS